MSSRSSHPFYDGNLISICLLSSWKKNHRQPFYRDNRKQNWKLKHLVAKQQRDEKEEDDDRERKKREGGKERYKMKMRTKVPAGHFRCLEKCEQQQQRLGKLKALNFLRSVNILLSSRLCALYLLSGIAVIHQFEANLWCYRTFGLWRDSIPMNLVLFLIVYLLDVLLKFSWENENKTEQE